MSTVINFTNVSYSRTPNTILSEINWQVLANERWAIIGPNGSGKTTLLGLAATLLYPSAGSIELLSRQRARTDVFEIRNRIGFASHAAAKRIPADETVLNAVMTAAYAVEGRWQEEYNAFDEERALEVLKQWSCAHLANQRIFTLSEGELKRVSLARATMTDPELLLLDEPAASLDLGARERLLHSLSDYISRPDAPAMVMVTHHVEEIPAGFTHALILKDAKVLAQGSIGDVITSENISEAFDVSVRVKALAGRFFVDLQ